MNSKDKTREKLVGSMRKTKAVAGIGKDLKADAKTGNPAVSEPAKPRSSRATGRATRAASSSRPETVKTDRYQSGRRVWPD